MTQSNVGDDDSTSWEADTYVYILLRNDESELNCRCLDKCFYYMFCCFCKCCS